MNFAHKNIIMGGLSKINFLNLNKERYMNLVRIEYANLFWLKLLPNIPTFEKTNLLAPLLFLKSLLGYLQ